MQICLISISDVIGSNMMLTVISM